MSQKKTTALKLAENNYHRFEELNGNHPWMEILPEGYVGYRVRQLNTGEVTYFNYILAKEMGLIDSAHPHQMTPELQQKLIDVFSIQIINEFDEINNRRFKENTIQPNLYMATRYVQLQHHDKTGKTSGDGRGIWNGYIQNRNKVWDVSSRGTGVTCLAPGAVQAQRPLETGNENHGYGCGRAEVDELYASAIMAEAMHLQGIKTERVLCIIDHGNGYGIGVRAAPNLIRPAHLFVYLKQNRHEELKKATDFLIERQHKNKEWIFTTSGSKKYDQLAEYVCTAFAEFTAQLDQNYIFAWLDWDGDNVLSNAAIIDYGSIRQFGIRHDQYRYDDVERFSTNLNEQKSKAKLIVKNFVQLCEYVKTGQKKPLSEYNHHPLMKKFDQQFEKHCADRLLYKMGFATEQRKQILSRSLKNFKKFQKTYESFEKAKVHGKISKVADGLNLPALYNMKNIFKGLSLHFHLHKNLMPPEQFFKIALSGFAKSKDTKLKDKQIQNILKFQSQYLNLFEICSQNEDLKNTFAAAHQRTNMIHKENLITGNAVIEVVNEVLQANKKYLQKNKIQNIIDKMVFSYVGTPEVPTSSFYKNIQAPQVPEKIYSKLIELVQEHREDI